MGSKLWNNKAERRQWILREIDKCCECEGRIGKGKRSDRLISITKKHFSSKLAMEGWTWFAIKLLIQFVVLPLIKEYLFEGVRADG